MNPNHLQFLNARRRLRSGPLATAAMSGPHHRPNGLAGLLAGICNLGSQTRLSTNLIWGYWTEISQCLVVGEGWFSLMVYHPKNLLLNCVGDRWWNCVGCAGWVRLRSGTRLPTAAWPPCGEATIRCQQHRGWGPVWGPQPSKKPLGHLGWGRGVAACDGLSTLAPP